MFTLGVGDMMQSRRLLLAALRVGLYNAQRAYTDLTALVDQNADVAARLSRERYWPELEDRLQVDWVADQLRMVADALKVCVPFDIDEMISGLEQLDNEERT